MKSKSCKWCKKKFTIERDKQICCSVDCAENYGKKVSAKAEYIQQQADRKVIQLRKDAIKTRSDYAKEAQTAFNAYIRERDKNLPCISCGRHHQGQYHAGHYRTVGAHPELRFNELNCHKQCSVCNNHKSGNIVEYRINLLAKIGHESLAWLEGSHEPNKHNIEALKLIKSTYKTKLKELKNGR